MFTSLPMFTSSPHAEDRRLTVVADDYSDVVQVLHYRMAEELTEDLQITLASQIEALGGEVVVLGRKPPSLEEKHLTARSPSRLHIDSIEVDSTWVHNYWGLLCQTDVKSFLLCATDIAQADRPKDAAALPRVAAYLHAPFLVSSLKLQGASIVSFGNGTAVVSRNVLTLNPDKELSVLRDQLAVMGIRYPIFCPSLPGEPGGHMDMCVGWLNEHAVVPSIDPRAIRFSQDRKFAEVATTILDRIAAIIQAHGYPVLRLTMPVPQGLNHENIVAYYTPVNWVIVVNQMTREKSVIIPAPSYDLPDSSLHEAYREQHARVFEALHVTPYYFKTIAPELGGGLKCMTGKLPHSLVARVLGTTTESNSHPM